MWRIALARQNLVKCTRVSRASQSFVRYKHQIPVTKQIQELKEQDKVDPLFLENNITPIERLVDLPLIQIGDYVEAFTNGQYSGMVVGQKRSSGGLQQLTVLLRNGKLFEVRSSNVAFCLKDFAKSQQVAQTVVDSFSPQDIDANGVLQNISPAYNRAIQHYQRTLKLNKGLAHQGLEQLHKHFIHPDKETQVSLDELAAHAFKTKQPSTLQRHVTFLHLASDNIHFVPTLDVRGSNTWILRSQKKSNKIAQVIESIRTRDSLYTGFLERVKPLVEFYNHHADPVLGTFSPTALEMMPKVAQELKESDKMFINFVVDWVKSPKVILASPYEVFVPSILKALKCYDDLFFDRSLAARFLKEVGMFKPWDNIGLLEQAPIAGEFFWTKESEENELKMESYANAFLNSPDSQDDYARIRHDFGDLPVYTIDDPSAKEIDDGVSIEHIPQDNSAWLHVHIADPTTFISPTHELSQLMLQKVQTLYLPEQHFPMLSEELSSKKFSLGSTAYTNNQGSQYAFTFSTRIDQNGNLLDYKVRPSLIKNVTKVYYDDLDRLLEPMANKMHDPLVDLTKSFSHPSNDAFALQDQQKSERPSTVPTHAEQDLLNIFRMANRHAAQRIRNGAVFFSRASPVISIMPERLDLPSFNFSKPSYASSLPAVRLGLDKSGYSSARQMVAETMIMGGRIASKFAQENGVVIPFRTQAWNPNASTSDIQLREELLASRDPVTVTTEAGLPHAIMGIQDGYTRATSPLRRYLDMVVHWQLKSHLMGQAPVFSADQLKALSTRILTREKQLSLLQQRSIQFWTIHLLDRMRADGFTQQMEWTCIINMPSRVSFTELGGAIDVATGTVLELGIRGRIEKLNRNLEVGDVVKVRVSSLDTLLGRLNLELI
ncbi:uncharacterized protein B0P05DRAFT_576244 [Gilbertella persicaria]|uniref:uncharacterized protein n=1 Tax=Gilbertella persicaria TaxID=101096 RepID=UPI00221E5532|nr:uncharacterized protein B0P05DRAFT_576244 [Gilbertella persicaria]KAI8047680.1 hypothetical protein B0P05DRAFT_576244 [Gilbertella persicaria]